MAINIKSSFKPQFRKSITNIFRDNPSRTNVGFTWFDSNFMWHDVEREIPEPNPSRTNLLTGEDVINNDL